MASSSILPMGCRFSPTDADLISFYLRPMISSEPLPDPAARFLHTADAYAADPAALVSGLLPAVLLAPRTGVETRCWYLFGSAKALSGHDKRRSRAVGGGQGTWHAEKGRVAVLDGEGRVVGYKQSFRYKPVHADGSVVAVWLMVEFRVKDEGDDEEGETVPVLCKVYQSPRKPRSASVPTSPVHKRERKRKAGDDSAPVKTVKRRLLVPLAAPILPPAVELKPDLNNCSDGVSLEVDQLLDDLMSGLTPDQVLGDSLKPFPESDVNCSFSMANHAGYAASSYCDTVLMGDLLMPVVFESEVNYSSSMSDHAGSMVSNYDTVLHGGSGTPLFHNSDQFDLSMPIFEPLPTDLQSQTAMLNLSFLSCAPYAGISDSWTGGDTTDDEVASVSWYDSAPSSPAIPTEWMMQSPFATPYLF